MTTIPEEVSELVDFPVHRPPDPIDKTPLGPSIDTILRRMNPHRQAPEEELKIGIEDCFSSLEKEEAELREKQREFARLQAETMERMRAARELEILLDARERLLDDRENHLASRMSNTLPSQEISALQKSLNDTRQALKQANQTIAEKESALAQVHAELAGLRAAPAQQPNSPGDASVAGYGDVTHKSLADQVAFLREREAFIEESENILFNKAQQLQEWEVRLQQNEHDRANSPSSAG